MYTQPRSAAPRACRRSDGPLSRSAERRSIDLRRQTCDVQECSQITPLEVSQFEDVVNRCPTPGAQDYTMGIRVVGAAGERSRTRTCHTPRAHTHTHTIMFSHGGCQGWLRAIKGRSCSSPGRLTHSSSWCIHSQALGSLGRFRRDARAPEFFVFSSARGPTATPTVLRSS